MTTTYTTRRQDDFLAAPTAIETPLPDGTLQAMIDYGEAAQADVDALLDALFARDSEEEAPPLPADLIDAEAELDDYLADIEDRNIWRRGMW